MEHILYLSFYLRTLERLNFRTILYSELNYFIGIAIVNVYVNYLFVNLYVAIFPLPVERN